MMRATLPTVACVAVLIAMNGQGRAAMITHTNLTPGFFDNSSGYRDLPFALGDFGGGATTVLDVDVSITFAKSDNNSFVPFGGVLGTGTPFYNEIEFALISPTGTLFTLISNNSDIELVAADNFETFNTGFGTGGFSGTINFDQSAAADVGSTPLAGTFRPDDLTANSLDIFNGESALGTWRLFIEDDVGADGLSFYEYSLTITTPSLSAVPEPTSLAIFGIGASLLGLGAARRRRREKNLSIAA